MKKLIMQLLMALGMNLGVVIRQRYEVECYGADGVLRWKDTFTNLVTTVGLNKYLDAALKTGLASPAWYVGLKGAGTVNAADTLASHAGWSEVNPYSGDRPAFTPGAIAAGSVDNSASKASYSITGSATVAGAFLADAANGTAGTLLGAGDFAGGSKSVGSGDTLNVTVTCSMTSS